MHTRFASRSFRRFSCAIIRNLVLAFAMNVKATVTTLQALFEQSFKHFLAVMTNGGFSVRMDDKRVWNFYSSGHFFLNPNRSTRANRWSSVLLNAWAHAPARCAVRNTLEHWTNLLEKTKSLSHRIALLKADKKLGPRRQPTSYHNDAVDDGFIAAWDGIRGAMQQIGWRQR